MRVKSIYHNARNTAEIHLIKFAKCWNIMQLPDWDNAIDSINLTQLIISVYRISTYSYSKLPQLPEDHNDAYTLFDRLWCRNTAYYLPTSDFWAIHISVYFLYGAIVHVVARRNSRSPIHVHRRNYNNYRFIPLADRHTAFEVAPDRRGKTILIVCIIQLAAGILGD